MSDTNEEKPIERMNQDVGKNCLEKCFEIYSFKPTHRVKNCPLFLSLPVSHGPHSSQLPSFTFINSPLKFKIHVTFK